MNFAEKLIELRKSKGWSQEELGEQLGVTRQTVSKWELGLTTPEMEKIAMLSELFNITTDELIKGKAPAEAPDTSAFSEYKIPDGTEVVFVEKKRKFGFEYKSERTWRGVPLVHINLKGGAHGVFALGLAARGIIAIGLAALGAVPIGLVAVGFLALGGFLAVGTIASAAMSVGVISIGGFAVGILSYGGVSAGWLSIGGLAVGKYAIGGGATGDIAIGGVADGIIAVGESVKGEIIFELPVKNIEEFRMAVLSRLPNTPKFILDLMSWVAKNLNVN